MNDRTERGHQKGNLFKKMLSKCVDCETSSRELNGNCFNSPASVEIKEKCDSGDHLTIYNKFFGTKKLESLERELFLDVKV